MFAAFRCHRSWVSLCPSGHRRPSSCLYLQCISKCHTSAHWRSLSLFLLWWYEMLVNIGRRLAGFVRHTTAASLSSHLATGYEDRQQLEVVSDAVFLLVLFGCNVSWGPQESQPAKVNALPDNEQKASSHKGLSSAAVRVSTHPALLHYFPLSVLSDCAHSFRLFITGYCWGHFDEPVFLFSLSRAEAQNVCVALAGVTRWSVRGPPPHSL